VLVSTNKLTSGAIPARGSCASAGQTLSRPTTTLSSISRARRTPAIERFSYRPSATTITYPRHSPSRAFALSQESCPAVIFFSSSNPQLLILSLDTRPLRRNLRMVVSFSAETWTGSRPAGKQGSGQDCQMRSDRSGFHIGCAAEKRSNLNRSNPKNGGNKASTWNLQNIGNHHV
jgi:hypothetical protein